MKKKQFIDDIFSNLWSKACFDLNRNPTKRMKSSNKKERHIIIGIPDIILYYLLWIKILLLFLKFPYQFIIMFLFSIYLFCIIYIIWNYIIICNPRSLY